MDEKKVEITEPSTLSEKASELTEQLESEEAKLDTSDIQTNGEGDEEELLKSPEQNHLEEASNDVMDKPIESEENGGDVESAQNTGADDSASLEKEQTEQQDALPGPPEQTEQQDALPGPCSEETAESSQNAEEEPMDQSDTNTPDKEEEKDKSEPNVDDAEVDEISKVDEDAKPNEDSTTVEEPEATLEEAVSKLDVTDSKESPEAADITRKEVESMEVDEPPVNSQNSKKNVDSIQFENAPNLQDEAKEESRDASQSLDPFDTLLNSTEEKLDGPSQKKSIENPINMDEDDDHDDGIQADDALADEVPADDEAVETLEGLGADEDVCLIPDTERELTEEDKEKALQAKQMLEKEVKNEEPTDIAESEQAEGAVNEEDEPMANEEDEATATNEEATEEPAETAEEAPTDEAGREEDKEKEKDGEELVDQNEPLEANTIQEIAPVDQPCTQCKETKSCVYRYLKDATTQYLCTNDCLKPFQEANPDEYTLVTKKNWIDETEPKEKICSNCEESKMCYFSYKEDGEIYQYCSLACLHDMMGDDRDKYVFKYKTVVVDEIEGKEARCMKCDSDKSCVYEFSLYGNMCYVCTAYCLGELNSEQNNRFKIKRKTPTRRTPAKKGTITAKKMPLLKLKVISNATDKYLDEGYKVAAKTPAAAAQAKDDRERSFIRRCTQCSLTLSGAESNLSWETMDFCDEVCLGRYQNIIGSKCANCKKLVSHTALGKYCVRFGYDIRQFCASTCLEAFKKGLKICCYCQKDMTGMDGLIASVGGGQFKDFCSRNCLDKFNQMSKNAMPASVFARCAVCGVEKITHLEVALTDEHSQRLCSEPCFAAFKFVNSIFPDQCQWCKKHFERKSSKSYTIYTDTQTHCFCTQACMNVFISNSRHIVPCAWCKVKKYNFDMIRRGGVQALMMCSLNCLNLYQVSVNAVSAKRIKCDQCKRLTQAQYHLTMSDATVRNFCTYQCVMTFQSPYNKAPMMIDGNQAAQAVPTGAPRRNFSTGTRSLSKLQQQQQQQQAQGQQQQGKQQKHAETGPGGLLPVISNVHSLASGRPPKVYKNRAAAAAAAAAVAQQQLEQQMQAVQQQARPPTPPPPLPPPPPPPPKIYNHVLVKTLPPAQVCNKATQSKAVMVSKGISCRPHPVTKECQTDDSLERRVLIPVPVPIYVPVPLAMWSVPFPLPVPIPIPVPTPVFIPTTRNSANGILKEIKKIHEKMPTDPFEAELLMMAEMVAGDKKRESDSETDDEENFTGNDNMETNQHYGEDVLQMALKMATEPYEEPPVDLESAMTASTITPTSHPMQGMDDVHSHHLMVLEQQRRLAATAPAPGRGGKRAPPAPQPASAAQPAGRRKRSARNREPPPAPEPPREPQEKPDANMCLKYTFGVNAWKQWVMTKNAELEKSSIRRKPFKSEILQLTSDELNYSLCLFVKEVRKPNGSEYAPDTIYYLVLGIQQYLFENGRIDNIFTDPYYEKFTDCLDEVAKKFSVLYNDSQYIVTRVEEEHLWECKQLGAHSPHVLLSTLMFFNTKHFNLVTVEEHMQLSFSHIMKHWKRNPNQPGAVKMAGSRNVLLRFYPPQSALDANSRKKKVYEQQENEENPLRCPVKLYEFYISKCPESVRTRNDVFYLMPERSCVPDSPVWYSTQPLNRDALAKMLHRVKMVKEINIALLTS